MVEFVVTLIFFGAIVCVEECLQNRRKTDATWD